MVCSPGTLRLRRQPRALLALIILLLIYALFTGGPSGAFASAFTGQINEKF
jgi:hypothetical protein